MILGIALRVYNRAVGAEGHALPPDFGRLINLQPVRTDYAKHVTASLHRIFRPSYGPVQCKWWQSGQMSVARY